MNIEKIHTPKKQTYSSGDCYNININEKTGAIHINVDVVKLTEFFAENFVMYASEELSHIWMYDPTEGLWQKLNKRTSLKDKLFNMLTPHFEQDFALYPDLYTKLYDAMKYLVPYVKDQGADADVQTVVSPWRVLFANGVFDYQRGAKLGEDDLTVEPIDDNTINEHFTNKVPIVLPNTHEERIQAEQEHSIIDDWLEWILDDDAKTFRQIVGGMYVRDYHLQYFTFWIHRNPAHDGQVGKSALADYLITLLGDDPRKPSLASAVKMEDLAGVSSGARFALAPLEHKYLNIQRELSAVHVKDHSQLKNATGNEAMPIEEKGIDQRQIFNYAKIHFLGNALPTFAKIDNGLLSRVIFLTFGHTISGDDPQAKYFNSHPEIYEDRELQGRFIWRCIKEYYAQTDVPNAKGRGADNFYQSDSAKIIHQKWMTGSTNYTQFITDNYVITGDENDYVFKDDFMMEMNMELDEDSSSKVSWKRVKDYLEREGIIPFSRNVRRENQFGERKTAILGMRKKTESEILEELEQWKARNNVAIELDEPSGQDTSNIF